MRRLQFEYKALNLFDEISTVEITLDTINSSIHLFDQDGAVYPQFNFVTKLHEANEEFWKLKETIEGKHLASTFFEEIEEETKWLFYTPRREVYCITKFEDKFVTNKISAEDPICLPYYINRL